MVRLQFYGTLRLMLAGKEGIDLPWSTGETVGRLLAKFQAVERLPATRKLLDEKGMLRAGTIILVNRRNILHLDGLETPVEDGDLLALFPPGAGG